jgi:hypothetical protein
MGSNLRGKTKRPSLEERDAGVTKRRNFLARKTAAAIAVLLGAIISTACAEIGPWQRDYDALLKKYVGGGGVRYAAWKASPADLAALSQVVTAIGVDNPKSLSREDQLAFYINAYNAWVVYLVLQKYPIRSVKDYAPFSGIFTGQNIRLAGRKTSLNYLEKDLIRNGFKDPRVHFALNCASRSCPVLIPAAYAGTSLNTTLDERARAYVVNPLGVQISSGSNAVRLSSIFKWYADDFKSEGGAVAFINRYRPQPLPKDAKIEFQDYDWSLNETR